MASVELGSLQAAVFQRCTTALCLVGPHNIVHSVNPEWERATGIPARDQIERDFFSLFPDGRVFSREVAAQLKSGEQAIVPRYRYEAGGVKTWWEVAVQPLDPDTGARYLISAKDITIRVQAELDRERLLAELQTANAALVENGARLEAHARAARQHSAQLSALLESVSDGITIADPSGSIILMNDVARELYRLAGGEIARVEDLTALDARRPNGQPLPFAHLPLVRALRGERFCGEELTVGSDDSRRWLRYAGSSVRDAEGSVVLAIEVAHDVTAWRRMEESRADYLAMISHDLRAPLTVINGRSELLCRVLGQLDLKREAHGAAAILQSARRMNSMLEDFVESVRLETGAFRLRKQPIDLAQFITQVVERLATQDHEVRVVVDAAAIPTIMADPGRLERALVNLITNALKYSPGHSQVCVSACQQSAEVVIAISDRGPGIPVERQDRLFQRFSRLSDRRSGEGFGLGLFITRLIAEAHGGRVSVESAPGLGSTFRIHLPV